MKSKFKDGDRVKLLPFDNGTEIVPEQTGTLIMDEDDDEDSNNGCATVELDGPALHDNIVECTWDQIVPLVSE
jgi:alpha-D-ribose 1-methylphosphonate 5-triphosphate synthase subunit PhnH